MMEKTLAVVARIASRVSGSRRVMAPLLGLAAGLLLAVLDGYFGGGDGRLAIFLIIAAVAGEILLRFARLAEMLRHPRRPDLHFVAGADQAWRRAQVARRLTRAVLEPAPFYLAAALTLMLLLRLSFGTQAAVAAALASEALILWTVLRTATRRGWIRPSRRKCFQAHPLNHTLLPAGRKRLFLRLTRALAGAASAWLPFPHNRLLARKLLYPLRADFGSFLIWLLILVCIGGACWYSGNPRFIGAFALLGAAAGLTAYQLSTREADRFQALCPYYFWDAPSLFRTDLLAALILSAPFGLFALGAQLSTGTGIGDPLAWKFALAPLLPALLAPLDDTERAWSSDRRLLMNAGYVGLTGYLLLLPLWVLLLFLGALASFAYQRAVRHPHSPPAREENLSTG